MYSRSTVSLRAARHTHNVLVITYIADTSSRYRNTGIYRETGCQYQTTIICASNDMSVTSESDCTIAPYSVLNSLFIAQKQCLPLRQRNNVLKIVILISIACIYLHERDTLSYERGTLSFCTDYCF